MESNVHICREGGDCDLCHILSSKYMEVISIIRVLEEKINEIKSMQSGKVKLGEILLTSIASVSLLVITGIISKGALVNSLATVVLSLSAISAATSRDHEEINIDNEDLRSLEELLEWYVKLKEAYALMLKACNL